MSIILLILKIIGIIILTILGLIITFILLVLFAPFRYEVKADYDNEIFVNAKFFWLMHIYSGFVDYSENKFSFGLKIFNHSIYPREIKETKKRKNKTKKINKPASDFDENKSLKLEKEEVKVTTNETNEAYEKALEINFKEDIKKNVTENIKEKNEEKLSFLNKLKFLLKKFYNFIINIKYSLTKIYDKILSIKDNFSHYMDIIQSDNTKIVFEKVKKAIYRLYRNVKPKRFYLKLHIGFGDNPDLEGKLLAVHGLLYPFHRGRVEITPDFETEEKTAHFYMKGKAKSYLVLRFFYLYYFDKDIKEFKELFNK